MIELISDVAARLRASAYPNEAAVREGIVVPILRALGWDTFDPRQVHPERPNAVGPSDYALLNRAGRPVVLIEVKAVGRSLDGDRQLFGYCFEVGVPIAVLTDGRGWSFYLPGGSGQRDERRFYSLQLDERSPDEAQAILERYLARERVLDRSAIEAARQDHERALDQREASATLPAAWDELVAEGNELLVETLSDKVEALCGFRPSPDHTISWLAGLRDRSSGATIRAGMPKPQDRPAGKSGALIQDALQRTGRPAVTGPPPHSQTREIAYRLFGEDHVAPNASRALVEVLRAIVSRDEAKIPQLAEQVASRNRRHIARTPSEINPNRPDLARGEEIAPGWLVGLTISNRDKAMIIRTACELYGLATPADVQVDLPNT
jgi:predicted type IV restriction endonuclease